MNDELRQALGLLTDLDRSEAERFLDAAVETASRVEGWDEFQAGLREADVDVRAVQEFLERADRELPDAWGAVRGFADHRPAELVQTLDEERAGGAHMYAGSGDSDWVGFTAFLDQNESSWQQTWPESRAYVKYQAGEAGFTTEAASFLAHADASSLEEALVAYGARSTGGAAEPDYARFTAFLDRNDSSWQETWPESREWMEYTAGQEGFVVETTSFLVYVDATTLADALVAYGATPTAASAAAGAPDEEPASPEQAAADAMALGRRAVEALREQVPDLVVTDEQLIAILDRELRAAAGA